MNYSLIEHKLFFYEMNNLLIRIETSFCVFMFSLFMHLLCIYSY